MKLFNFRLTQAFLCQGLGGAKSPFKKPPLGHLSKTATRSPFKNRQWDTIQKSANGKLWVTIQKTATRALFKNRHSGTIQKTANWNKRKKQQQQVSVTFRSKVSRISILNRK